MVTLSCLFSSCTTVSFLTALLLQTLLLPAGTARVRTSSRISPDVFGVVDMLPDKRPSALSERRNETSQAWAEVQTVILSRLADVRDGLAENFCWVSHEEILDDRNLICEGGLVAVVQKQSSWRVNFYQMQKFRSWVQVKPLDLGFNRNFADETDVWVVRLTDETEGSKAVLPNLAGATAPRSRPNRFAPQRERAARMRRPDFLRSLSTANVGQDVLIPALVPGESEVFSFRLDQETSLFRVQNQWRWNLVSVRFSQGAPSQSFPEGLPVLKGYSRRFTADAPWTVRDNSDRVRFTIESRQNGTEYHLLQPTNFTTLFTIRINRQSEQYFASDGRWRWKSDIDVLHGAGGDTLYHGRTAQGLDRSLPFYRGHRQQVFRRRVAEFHPAVNIFHTHTAVDSALLLVASALAFS